MLSSNLVTEFTYYLTGKKFCIYIYHKWSQRSKIIIINIILLVPSVVKICKSKNTFNVMLKQQAVARALYKIKVIQKHVC